MPVQAAPLQLSPEAIPITRLLLSPPVMVIAPLLR
jgi:hypothetical protein